MKPLGDFLVDFKRIQVCAYDAGGANVLVHLVANLKLEVEFSIGGQAQNIFKNQFPDFVNQNDLLADTDLLLSGTGWQTTFEFDMMDRAKKSGICVVAVMDHWVNYRERFTRYGRILNPDYFCVFDDFAAELVSENFGTPNILFSENYFLKTQSKLIREKTFACQESTKIDYLFIGEPVSRNRTDWDEFMALSLFFNSLRSLGKNKSNIVIRPHPTEISGKYNNRIPSDFPNTYIVENLTLVDLIAQSTKVVGCHSMALVLAEAANKEILVCLPDEETPLVPLSNFKRLYRSELM